MNLKHPSEEILLDYQFNLLEARPAAETKAHLQSCASCREKAGRLRSKMAGLDALAKPSDVPERLIAGVLREARKEKAPRETVIPGFAWFAGVAAAAALLLILLNPQPRMKSFDGGMAAPVRQTVALAVKVDAPSALRVEIPTPPAADLAMFEEPELQTGESAPPENPPQVMVVAMMARQEPASWVSESQSMPVARQSFKALDQPAGENDQRARMDFVPKKTEAKTIMAARKMAINAAPPPAPPQGPGESQAEVFKDFSLTQQPAGAEGFTDLPNAPPSYSCSLWNTNAYPLRMTFEVEISQPQWALKCNEPGVTTTWLGERNWQLRFGLGPMTNRSIIYSLVPAP
ncbi:MAG: hypothetical protein V2A34_02950 [Lentisphaerota bacterium]